MALDQSWCQVSKNCLLIDLFIKKFQFQFLIPFSFSFLFLSKFLVFLCIHPWSVFSFFILMIYARKRQFYMVDGPFLCGVSFFHKRFLATCSIMEHEKHLSILYQMQVQATQFSSKVARDKWLQNEIDFGLIHLKWAILCFL